MDGREDYTPQLRRLIDDRRTLSEALTEFRTITNDPLSVVSAVSAALGIKAIDARAILREVPAWRSDMLKVDRDTNAFLDVLEEVGREIEREFEEEELSEGAD
jgi:hypothetical protein